MTRAQTPAKPTLHTPKPGERSVLGLFTPGGAMMAGAVIVALVALFYRWLLQQNAFSSNAVEDWGHAYVIPVISGYMIWLRKDELATVQPRVFWGGLLPIALGLACYAFFTLLLPNHMLQGAAFILTIFGVTLTLLGTSAMRILFLPIAYLVFAITISEQIMIEMTFRLQLIASEGAYVMLDLGSTLGLPYGVNIEGNQIEILVAGESRMMNVAEACSGMRMVVAFIALAGAVALLGAKHWWQRLALMLMAVPVAVFMNVVRVAVLGFVTLWDQDLAAGDSHTLIGTLLLLPALGLYMLIAWVLNRIVASEEPAE